MIYQGLLVPSETPPTLRQIKRALLSYDKVLILDPADRDLVPSHVVDACVFGTSMGIVNNLQQARPLGKIPAYDDFFQKSIEGAADALKDGAIQIISTYNPVRDRGVWIGTDLRLGGYPLHPGLVLRLYRHAAANQKLLSLAIASDEGILSSNSDDLLQLALKGSADSVFNGPQEPAYGPEFYERLPIIEADYVAEEKRTALTLVARARLATVIKLLGYCDTKDIVPVFSTSQHWNVLNEILRNTQAEIDSVATDPFIAQRTRLVDIAHSEFLDDAVLDQLSVKDVLRLRTKAWGRQAQSREALFRTLYQLASEIKRSEDFESQARERIRDYRSELDDVAKERRKLRYKIECDIGIGLAAAAGGVGCLNLHSNPLSDAASAIALGVGALSLKAIREYGPAWEDFKARQLKLKNSIGFGLEQFYKVFGSK